MNLRVVRPTANCNRSVRALSLLVAFLALAASVHAEPLYSPNSMSTFGPGIEVDAGGYPLWVAIADVNADGWPDLVWTRNAYYPEGHGLDDCYVAIRLGNGDGTFRPYGPSSFYRTRGNSQSLAIADLNADRRPDIVTTDLHGVAGTEPRTGTVLLGNGDGTFRQVADYITGAGPIQVAIADLNADGRPDLVTANSGVYGSDLPSTVSVMLGNGDGTFGLNSDYATGPPGHYTPSSSVAIADLNADGRLDLAVVTEGSDIPDSTVLVLLGNGDGTFDPLADFRTARRPASVAIADLNADGRPDLTVECIGRISVLLGNGDGTFGTRIDYAGLGSTNTSFAIADLDGDGRPDLAVPVPIYLQPTVAVLSGNGDGTFGTRIDYGTGERPQWVATDDLNVDGRPDLVVANYSSRTFTVLLNSDQPTATLRGRFDAAAVPDGIELKWSFGDASLVASASVERAPHADGPWTLITPELRHDGDVTAALDRTAETGRTYFYRLVAKLADGSSVTFGPISSSTSASIGESAVSVLASNPARATSQIEYSVPRAGRVRLDVTDVAGRVVTTLFDGVQRSGRFQVAWDGTNRGGERLSAGLYFVRLATPDRTVATRITRLP